MGFEEFEEIIEKEQLAQDTWNIEELVDLSQEPEFEEFFEIANTNNMEVGSYGKQTAQKHEKIAKEVSKERVAAKLLEGVKKSGRKLVTAGAVALAILGGALLDDVRVNIAGQEVALSGSVYAGGVSGKSSGGASHSVGGARSGGRSGASVGVSHGGAGNMQHEYTSYNGKQIRVARSANKYQAMAGNGGVLYHSVFDRETFKDEKGKDKKTAIFFLKDAKGNFKRIELGAKCFEATASIDDAQAGSNLSAPLSNLSLQGSASIASSSPITPNLGGGDMITRAEYNKLVAEVNRLSKSVKGAHGKADKALSGLQDANVDLARQALKIGDMKMGLDSTNARIDATNSRLDTVEGNVMSLANAQAKLVEYVKNIENAGTVAITIVSGAILLTMVLGGVAHRASVKREKKIEADAKKLKEKFNSFGLKKENTNEVLKFDL